MIFASSEMQGLAPTSTWFHATSFKSWGGALVVAVGATEIALGILVFDDPTRLPRALQLHGVLVAALLLTIGWRRSPPASQRLGFAVLMIASLGPLGALGALGVALLVRLFADKTTPFPEWYASLFPETAAHPTQALYEHILIMGGALGDASSGVVPFGDILSTGSTTQKQAVIMLIAERFRPAFSAPLLRALNDPDAAVRVQAATAASRIETRFLEEAMRLERDRHARPTDALTVLKLARHQDTYAATGLLEPARSTTARLQALALYRLHESLSPGDIEVGTAIGRLLLRLDRIEDAAARLERLVESLEPPPPPVVAWYLESLYRLQRWDALRAACARHEAALRTAPDLAHDLRQAVRLWAGSGSETTAHA